jgi:hypothetical protein
MFLEGAVKRILRRVMAASHGLYTSFPAFEHESHYNELGTAGTKRTTSEECLYILPLPVNLVLYLIPLTSLRERRQVVCNIRMMRMNCQPIDSRILPAIR